MNAQALITWIIIGIVAGFLASLVVGGGGLITYLITGILGALLGGFLANQFNISLNLGNPYVDQIVIATVGAIIVVILARLIL